MASRARVSIIGNNIMDIDSIVDLFGFGCIVDLNNFLKTSPDFDINGILYMGATPLGIAVRFSNYDIVEFLITLGADIDKCDRDLGGEPPVKLAFDQKDLKMYEMLRSRGADLCCPGWMGISVEDRLRELDS